MKNTVAHWKSAWLYQLGAALLFVAALALVEVNVQSGMNDDWSYIYTVRGLASTGHLSYNGWSAPLIGFQAYWGALFVRIFGFSFLAVRASSWVLTLLSIPVLWSLLRSVEISEEQAFFGLLAFLLSPLTLPNLATFMTDMPAFLLFAATLWSSLKAWESVDNKKAACWIIATTICGLLSGSVRQIYWLGSICVLTTLAFTRLRSASARGAIAACIGVTLALGAAGSLWLARQPYVPADFIFQTWHRMSWRSLLNSSIVDVVRDFIGLALLCVPVSLPLAYAQARRVRPWVHLLVLPISFGVAHQLDDPLPWTGNTITDYGVVSNGMLSVGDKPVVLSHPLMEVLGAIGMVSAAYAIWSVVQRLRRFSVPDLAGFALDTGAGRLAVLTLPFLCLYAIVISIRAPEFGLFDRYLIPHLFVAILLALAIYARSGHGVSRLGLAAGGIFALYAVATTHDYFAEARAKLEAANEVLRAGYPRTAIMGGFEFDSWTQVERTGHINNRTVTFPPDAYHQTDDCDGPDDTQVWWRSMTPDLKARYVISLTPIEGLPPAEFAPVDYLRWLPPKRSRIFIERVPSSDPPLTCEPGNAQ